MSPSLPAFTASPSRAGLPGYTGQPLAKARRPRCSEPQTRVSLPSNFSRNCIVGRKVRGLDWRSEQVSPSRACWLSGECRLKYSIRRRTMAQTIIQHVLSRLYDLGVKDVFGVPGDYAFPINDAVCSDSRLRWVGCCNELNAAYAADGYARIRGLAALNTTYGVGELSAINGITGAYAEHLPIFHLVGMPASTVQQAHGLVHHTLGNGEFDLFHKMTEPVVCARAIMTPDNCVAETERLIAAALYHRRPVYMAFPFDYANLPVVASAPTAAVISQTDQVALEAAVAAIADAIHAARSACILPGILIARCGLGAQATAVVEASGLPFATMFMDKSVLDESHPQYIGMYDGRMMNEDIRAFVEGCDCVLGIGAMLTDFNSGAFTATLDRSRSINIMPDRVRVGTAVYYNVGMKDVLNQLAARLPHKDVRAPRADGLGEPAGA